MKTTKNLNRASKMATALYAVIALGTSVWAQPYANSNSTSTEEIYNRLETLMASTEEAIKYKAPSVNEVEVNEAMERLEFLANKIEQTVRYEAPSTTTAELNEAVERLEILASNIENEIRYKVHDEEQANSVEYAVGFNDQANETLNALALVIAYLKNK